MPIFGLPLVKILPIGIKFITDPMKSALKNHCKTHPGFRHYVIELGYWSTNWTTKFRLREKNLTRTKEQTKQLSKIDEAKAIETGAEVVASVFNAVVSRVLLYLVYYMSIDAEKKKKEQERLERLEETKLLTSYGEAIGELRLQIIEVNERIEKLEKKNQSMLEKLLAGKEKEENTNASQLKDDG